MSRLLSILSILYFVAPLVAPAQPEAETSERQATRISTTTRDTLQNDYPAANPGRPTVSTPATLTPVGYLQFETGFLRATYSPEFSSQSSFNEVMKFSVSRRIELFAADGPFARSRAEGRSANGAGDLSLGVQAVFYVGEGSRPTMAVSYFRRFYSGEAPDIDLGSARNSIQLLLSADVKGFHCDTNYFLNEVTDSAVHRAQFGQNTIGVAFSG